MHRIVRAAFAAVLLTSVPAIARAAEPAFTGSHVEAVAGWDQTDLGPGAGAREGLLYGIAAGHDWAAGPLRLGVEGEVLGSTVKGPLTGGTERVGRSLYAGARLGVPLARRFEIYAKGGYANGRFSGPNPYTGDGWRLGGGGELALTEHLFLRAEFRYSDYGRRARGQQVASLIGWRF